MIAWEATRGQGEIIKDIRFARLTKRAGLDYAWLRQWPGKLPHVRWLATSAGWLRQEHPRRLRQPRVGVVAGHGISLAHLFDSCGLALLSLISGGAILTPLLLVALGLLVRAITAYSNRQRPQDALLMPVSVLLMTMIARQALWWRWSQGGPTWKGRVLAHG